MQTLKEHILGHLKGDDKDAVEVYCDCMHVIRSPTTRFEYDAAVGPHVAGVGKLPTPSIKLKICHKSHYSHDMGRHSAYLSLP